MAVDHTEDDVIEDVKEDEIEGVEEHEEEEATAKVDSEIDDAADDAEREEIRERRRAERKNKNQRHREKLEALERNLQQLQAQNQALQAQVGTIQDSNVGAQLAQVDQAIQQAHNAAEHFKNIISQATARGDGKTVADATEYMIASRNRANELTQFKTNATRAINAPKPLNPQMVNKSQQFLGKNQWYGGPSSADPDSKVLTALDNSLTAEGWDSTDDSYWNELDKRAQKYLPHRYSSTTRPRNTVTGASASSASGDRGEVFKLSPDRVAAIKAAGMWDDPDQRKQMINTYRKFDKSNSRG